MSESASPSIEVSDSANVRTLTFAREDKLNAFNAEMYTRLASLIRQASDDDSVHVLIIAAKGRAFTAGQDLGEMAQLDVEDSADEGPVPFEQVFEALEACTVPIFAAVEGFGLGFGLTLLLHTDQNFISREARFRLPFLQLGVVPEAASSFLLPLRVGFSKASEWIYGGAWISSAELHDAGLVRELTEPGQAYEQAFEAAAALAKMPPKATAATKALLWKPIRDEIREARRAEGDAFRERLGSPENIAAITAFQARTKR